ncbi:hypothetical protein BGZ99_002178 [Dissophora globulifera]|uniref:Uncharacterized protein n=1 Tax=Dissophora globulifera TaxID=979702 RepID=A0A9P6UXH0_9FUNG|nr:hypothetical protein BGZ99_002178 [Dissophora globulifera]
MLAIRSTLKLDAPIAYITTPIPTASSTSPASSSSPPPELASESASISTRASVSSKQLLPEEPKIHLMVSLTYLRVLLELSNDKFRMNVAQMGRFESRLKEYLVDNNNNDNDSGTSKTGDQGAWEDKDARRERKRREGLLKQQQAQEHKAKAEASQEAAEAAAQPETTAALHQ